MAESPNAKSSKSSEPSSKNRTIPQKCQKCAMLSAVQAKAMHGSEGDNCWEPSVCYSRRSYARHRDRRNQIRNRKRQEQTLEQIPVAVEALDRLCYAVLIVYREAGAETPVHAITAQVWQGQEQCAIVQPIHCVGMVPSQVHVYVQKVLDVLKEKYGIKKFVSLERLDPQRCPLRPCIHHPEVLT
jgi:hypothetical protein